MAAVSGAPKRKEQAQPMPQNSVSEKDILDIINKGGTPTLKPKTEKSKSKNAEKGVKGITLLLTFDEMSSIDNLRNLRPKARGKKKAISLHDWIVEAVQEKIERESK